MPENAEIVRDPAILAGKPVIRGTRISVEFILELMSGGWTIPNILENYPHISEAQVFACLRYAQHVVQREKKKPLSPAA